MKDFSEKTVYIVGGSSGIGLATANVLSAKGAHIIVFARRKERLEHALKEIASNGISKQQRFSCMQMDVSKRDDVSTVMSRAVSEFGVPDVLINCAGRAYPHYFEEVSYEQFDETMKINLYGAWNTISTLVPYMKKRGGYIVNLSLIHI